MIPEECLKNRPDSDDAKYLVHSTTDENVAAWAKDEDAWWATVKHKAKPLNLNNHDTKNKEKNF